MEIKIDKIVCLVSRQPMANLLPVLMYNPKKVFLLGTTEEISTAYHLKVLLEEKKIETVLYDDIRPYDDTKLIDKLTQIIQENPDDIYLNVTGGTKLMAISAYEFFLKNNKPVFYCNTNDNSIIHLLPEKFIFPLSVDVSIEDYLGVYGYKIFEEKKFSSELGVTKFLEWLYPDKLNSFITFADKLRTVVNLNEPRISRRIGDYLFEKHFDIARVKHFPSDTILKVSADFFHGNWFEAAVEKILLDVLCCNVKSGVKIISSKGIKNEIDHLLVYNQQLFLFSCKSGKIGKAGMKEHLAELEVLRTLTGGTFGKAFFIFTSEIPEVLENRAKEFNIKPVPITQLEKFLRDEIKN